MAEWTLSTIGQGANWSLLPVGITLCAVAALLLSLTGSRDSLFVRALYSWSKGCKFESWQERQENFPLQSQLCVLTLIRCAFHPCVTAVAGKRPRSFCQKCRWQVTPKHAYTPFTQQSWSGLTMPLSRHSLGIYQEVSSHATCQETLRHNHLSLFSHCGLILA